MLEILTDEERQYIIVQQYIPEVLQGDKRIILIEGEPVGWMARVPQPGDHRGNMHVGAIVESFSLSEKDREICRILGPRLKELGLLFVGIDIIGEYLTEINVTSPTGIQEINPMMGIAIESLITDAVIRRCKERKA
jgi:glutathione synthase